MNNILTRTNALAATVILLASVSIIDIACSHGNNKNDRDYVAAIRDNDFELAHEILDDLYVDLIKSNSNNSLNADKYSERYWAAADHIYKAEMNYLLSENDPEANKRMIYTLANMNIVGDVVKDGEHISYNQIHPAESCGMYFCCDRRTAAERTAFPGGRLPASDPYPGRNSILISRISLLPSI